MKKILATDPIHPDATAFLESEGFHVIQLSHPSEAELIKAVKDVDAIICRTSTKITTDVLNAAKKLSCIGVHATGWNHINVETASKNGVKVLGYSSTQDGSLANQYDGSFVPVAEYVLMTMLATTKRLIEADQSMKAERWDKYSLSGGELYGKTLGIVGLGRIGSLVAERAKAFGMDVIAHHPRITSEEAEIRGATLKTLDEVLSESDYITIHTPQTEETIDLINIDSFAKMQKRPVVINTSRAPVVNEDAILEALEKDLIRAAVLDVFTGAPKNVNWTLAKHPRVITTPHIAGVSDESLSRVSGHITNLVTDYLNYGKINGLINREVLDN